MALLGSHSGLHAFRARVAAMALRLPQVAAVAAESLDGQVRAEWTSGAGPDGAWRPDKPSTTAHGTTAILLRSGAMLASLTVLPEGTRIKLSVGTPYLRYQAAKGRNPFPSGSLPDAWKQTLKAAAAASLGGAR